MEPILSALLQELRRIRPVIASYPGESGTDCYLLESGPKIGGALLDLLPVPSRLCTFSNLSTRCCCTVERQIHRGIHTGYQITVPRTEITFTFQ